ncbi:Gfo/Idh/MocA family protein [Paenibacillus sp. N3.4]|uniref:Gfo/Idh/MocA family protein n=1 Tax=Paenibacillus sp. N3.4 TaxID=2603222 RepID=UPI0011C9B922|nr:Gfo/Idh/MocA family oxidoreductase [Paenibacillus sp. N3.4]TXK84586.1 Gfo/Idh/MocA family oxidoreductase [Paenibacillus sp. N3.4]
MIDTVKLGIIGFGRIAELIHLPLLKQLPEIEVCGIFDVTPQRLALAAKRGFPIYSELEELLDSQIDAVLIATPPNSHYQIAAQALRYGKHVIIEKPVTLDAAEAIHLKAIADQEGKSVTVFHNRRFDSDFLLAKQIVAEGTLGDILFVERRYHTFGSGAAFGVKSFHQAWRNEKAYGGGALLDWGVHLIDQLLNLGLGSCVEIHASMNNLRWQQGEVDDYVHATMSTEQQVIMSMDINFASNVPSPLWIIGGDQATLQIMSDREAFLYEKGKPIRELKLEGQAKSGVLPIYSSFADCILNGGKLAITLEEAIETMKVLDKIRGRSQQNKELAHGNPVLGPTV